MAAQHCGRRPQPVSGDGRDSSISCGGSIVASVQDRVIDIVASQLGVSKDQITPETSFINDLGADSLDTVELVMELEEEFEINIPDDAAEKIQTVGQAVEFIEKNQS
jgi:acyl carrier protein